MTQLDQEIPKIKGSTILSTLDVASGFWTIPVHPDDQHKLAFTFGNRQYTFTRCPFGYANSPAEFNIFLNKACPDARARGNLVYVDDVLMKSSSVEDHLQEINHVLNQLTTAGAKIALHKGQWCETKVNYVGLLVGRNGIEPQSNRTQAIQSIKMPTNLSVSSFKYLGVNISEDLTWTTHIQTQVKKARQRLYHLRQLRKFRVSPTILKTFYAGTIESVLTQCISVWYGNSSSQDCKALQRVVRLAERISGSALPSLQDIYLKRCRSRAIKIIKDSNHPGNCLFTLLPSGKRFRSLMAKTERLRRSFFPKAIRLLNSNSAS